MTGKNEDAQRQYRRYRTIAIWVISLGAIITVLLFGAGAPWAGLLIVLIGIVLLWSARAQLNRPTLEALVYSGQLDVVGESFHTANLHAIFTAAGRDQTQELTATLLPDPTNKYDANAVAVGITVNNRNRLVGHLPKELARTIGPLLKTYTDRGALPTVSAYVREPFRNERGELVYQVILSARKAE